MNDSNIKKLSEKLFQNSRMSMDFYMPVPKGIWATKDHSQMTIDLNPAIYLKYKPKKNVKQEYDYVKASYRITPRNFYKVFKFFNTIMKWFYDDKYNDLFLIGEDESIIFNADYNKLHVTTPRGDYETQLMQAIPTIVEIGQKKYEGVHIYINQSIYCIPLTFEEVSVIFSILRDFSFPQEISKVLTAFQYIVSHDMVGIVENIHRKTPFD